MMTFMKPKKGEIEEEGFSGWLWNRITEIIAKVKEIIWNKIKFWGPGEEVKDTTKDVKEMEDKNIALQIRKLQKANASEEDKERVEELKAEIDRRKNLKDDLKIEKDAISATTQNAIEGNKQVKNLEDENRIAGTPGVNVSDSSNNLQVNNNSQHITTTPPAARPDDPIIFPFMSGQQRYA